MKAVGPALKTVVPALRIRAVNEAPVRETGTYVLYWMIAARRTRWNFALDQAIAWSRSLGKPLVIFEPLRCGYRWASDRLHRFVIEGMAANAADLADVSVTYYPYVEPAAGVGSGLLEALAKKASVVVTDEFPSFFLPRMVSAAGERLGVRLEAVDGNGLLPLRAADRVFKRAVDFRRFLQRTLAPHLLERPEANPLRGATLPAPSTLPATVRRRWPAADLEALLAAGGLAELPIDHAVAPVTEAGGRPAAEGRLDRWVAERRQRYAEGRNDVRRRVTSELSPYLHFGHVSAHQIFAHVVDEEGWNPGQLGDEMRGARSGWWGLSAPAEQFLDQLVTWRELGYNMSAQVPDYDRYESLPPWARATLAEHQRDPRSHVYSLEQFARGETHDELWNAAQNELRRDGIMHNYLRMLWGKKILEWTARPEDALDVMIELNNRFALDGRNPNSYSGIFWCLGRYDRAWGPERPIFGKIRYMSSDSTRRKLDAKAYIAEFGTAQSTLRF